MNAALELVNSEWWRGVPERASDKLVDPAWITGFLGASGLGELPTPSPKELRTLQALRSTLRRLVEAPTGADLGQLDGYLSLAPVRRRYVDGRVELEPVVRDWAWATSEIAASFVELVTTGEPSRIKVCANHDCQWTFYDASKNRSRRWCGAASCGTADKVRRFRARRRAALA